MRIFLAALATVAACVLPLHAGDVEADAKALEAMLVAPCCWSQQVSLHQSEAAEEIKRDVRTALRSGRTRQQVVDAYVERYGVRILVEPPARGFAMWLYVLPVVTLVFSAGGLAFVVKRFASRKRADEPMQSADSRPGGDSELAERLDDELRDMD